MVAPFSCLPPLSLALLDGLLDHLEVVVPALMSDMKHPLILVFVLREDLKQLLLVDNEHVGLVLTLSRTVTAFLLPDKNVGVAEIRSFLVGDKGDVLDFADPIVVVIVEFYSSLEDEEHYMVIHAICLLSSAWSPWWYRISFG